MPWPVDSARMTGPCHGSHTTTPTAAASNTTTPIAAATRPERVGDDRVLGNMSARLWEFVRLVDAGVDGRPSLGSRRRVITRRRRTP